MARVIADQSMSLDGFSTGPGVGIAQPFGRNGEKLHEWLFAEGGPEVNREIFELSGAVVMGRRMLVSNRLLFLGWSPSVSAERSVEDGRPVGDWKQVAGVGEQGHSGLPEMARVPASVLRTDRVGVAVPEMHRARDLGEWEGIAA